jgi:hypothetical protein
MSLFSLSFSFPICYVFVRLSENWENGNENGNEEQPSHWHSDFLFWRDAAPHCSHIKLFVSSPILQSKSKSKRFHSFDFLLIKGNDLKSFFYTPFPIVHTYLYSPLEMKHMCFFILFPSICIYFVWSIKGLEFAGCRAWFLVMVLNSKLTFSISSRIFLDKTQMSVEKDWGCFLVFPMWWPLNCWLNVRNISTDRSIINP